MNGSREFSVGVKIFFWSSGLIAPAMDPALTCDFLLVFCGDLRSIR